jgi:hypothetical protein
MGKYPAISAIGLVPEVNPFTSNELPRSHPKVGIPSRSGAFSPDDHEVSPKYFTSV